MDVEKEFDSCVDSIGGLRVDKLVGPSPGFKNADYLFHQYKIVAELKVLEEDKIFDQKNKEKASNSCAKYFDNGLTPNIIVVGSRITTTDDTPNELKQELLELYRVSLHRVIETANKQIKSTKAHLNLKDNSGLLILVNNGHTALSPDVLMYLLKETFRRFSFSSIDSVLYFTIDPSSEHNEISEDFYVWMAIEVRSETPWPSELFNRLSKS
jgi:hypothetical protein